MTSPTRLRYAILVLGPAYGTQQAFLAYQFAAEVVSLGHSITSIFFYGEGVLNAAAAVSPANDEYHLSQAWQTLSRAYNLPLHYCSSAGSRRGIDEQNTAPGFTLSSLSEWNDVLLHSDRVIQF